MFQQLLAPRRPSQVIEFFSKKCLFTQFRPRDVERTVSLKFHSNHAGILLKNTAEKFPCKRGKTNNLS